MTVFFKSFSFSLAATIIVALLSVRYLGAAALGPLIILSIIEITFSFDNAVLNARILKKMSPLWQRLFLSVGIIIAIFGMRLIFPILIVALTADLSWHQVVDLALNQPAVYAHKLEVAQPIITAFGGAFLMMLALHFFMDSKKDEHWFGWSEQFAQKAATWWLPTLLTLVTIIGLAVVPLNHHGGQTLQAGLVGAATFIAINGLTLLLSKTTKATGAVQHYTGWTAFTMFLYLELLDASFSLDGVLGAFAITDGVLLIVAGLGIGAVWVRSMTVFMVRRGTLDAYRYLEHGAHYAIGVLAAAMLLTAIFEVPDALTGILGLLFIAGSVVASIQQRKTEVA